MTAIWIAHRGNRRGKQPELENKPSYIVGAIDEGFQVEVDVWCAAGQLWLGHDHPEDKISPSWFFEHEDYLWIHCKNLGAVEYFAQSNVNWFFHQTDDVALTSKGFLWCYPGIAVPGRRTVLLDFEREITAVSFQDVVHYAICADLFSDLN